TTWCATITRRRGSDPFRKSTYERRDAEAAAEAADRITVFQPVAKTSHGLKTRDTAYLLIRSVRSQRLGARIHFFSSIHPIFRFPNFCFAASFDGAHHLTPFSMIFSTVGL